MAVMYAKRPEISPLTCCHKGGTEGTDWSLEVALEKISVKANRGTDDFGELRFRAAGVFVFSWLFFQLSVRGLVQRGLAGEDRGATLKAR